MSHAFTSVLHALDCSGNFFHRTVSQVHVPVRTLDVFFVHTVHSKKTSKHAICMEANGNKVLILYTEMPEKQTVHRKKKQTFTLLICSFRSTLEHISPPPHTHTQNDFSPHYCLKASKVGSFQCQL